MAGVKREQGPKPGWPPPTSVGNMGRSPIYSVWVFFLVRCLLFPASPAKPGNREASILVELGSVLVLSEGTASGARCTGAVWTVAEQYYPSGNTAHSPSSVPRPPAPGESPWASGCTPEASLASGHLPGEAVCCVWPLRHHQQSGAQLPPSTLPKEELHLAQHSTTP
ncbi:unnamed protein product [Rangifer tarandus platyrhynchus]|uniref:Uncharacterized protein n=2 Tax=Rangifer tarandus platyrhynchus TaxID=3082113 RepID=A0ABN8Z294_RANTA|nr:unnamed protein product [Rangifer tarandus platyrhynchus]